MRRSALRRSPLTVIGAAVITSLLLAACSGSDGDEEATTTSAPASQFGSSMGATPGDVGDVAAFGNGPTDGQMWEVPVGLSVCGRFVDVPSGTEVNGVTAGPASASVVGTGSDEAPTLGDFAESAGVQLGAGRLGLPEDIVPAALDNTDPPTQLAGATLATGGTCGATPAEVQVWVYSEDARESGDGILVVTQDLANIPFAQEQMAMVIAFAPESSLPTLPPSALGG